MTLTSDDQNELFDVVDEDDNVIGRATRGEVHKDRNLIHRSIGVFVFNDKGEIFLQKRSATKDTDPNKWTISCSGHVNREFKIQKVKSKKKIIEANIYRETAKREILEELGVELDIIPVCKYLCYAPNETEMAMLFKAYSDGPFKLNRQEISGGEYFTQNELTSQVVSGKIKLSFMGKMALEKIGWRI